MSNNKVKDWLLGLVTTNTPMGRINYLLSNIAVNTTIFATVFCISYAMMVTTKGTIDVASMKITITTIYTLLFLYLHYTLMARRIWHITEDKSTGRTRAFILAVFYAITQLPIPFIGIVIMLVLFVAEICLLFMPGVDMTEEDIQNEVI